SARRSCPAGAGYPNARRGPRVLSPSATVARSLWMMAASSSGSPPGDRSATERELGQAARDTVVVSAARKRVMCSFAQPAASSGSEWPTPRAIWTSARGSSLHRLASVAAGAPPAAADQEAAERRSPQDARPQEQPPQERDAVELVDPVERDPERRGGDQDEAGHELGPAKREVKCDPAAQRMAEHERPRDRERFDD